MSGRSILVFGASGFIASYLVDALLAQGDHVVATDLSEAGREHYEQRGVPFVVLDITRKEDFARLPAQRFVAVVHLSACQPANVGARDYDPRRFIEVNVLGTLNVLDYCREHAAGRIVYASSHRNTQGLWAGASRAIRESDGRRIKPSGEYAMFSISETAAQDCVEHYEAQHGLRGIVFRLPPVYGYGPHMEIFKDGKPIKTGFQVFIEKAMAGEPLEVWGDADAGRDIIYVKDVVDAFLKAISHPSASGLYNITSGRYLTLREQAETIADMFWGGEGAPVIVMRPELPNGIDTFLYDISRAREELGWTPRHSFRDMLEDYVKESDRKAYEYLVDKRRRQLANS